MEQQPTVMDNQSHQQHDKLIEIVRHETEETRRWDIALGCGMAAILLIDHEIFTRNALIVFLIIQVLRYKIQVYDNVFMVTYRMTSMEDRMEYLHAAQYSRVTLKLSTYLIMTAVYFCLYAVTANPYAWLFMRWSVALATILV
jgi:hypothetical protein